MPIADIPLAELRRRVALVPQEVELFEGTIRDNVTLFDPEPTDADVEQALRHVGLDALVDTGIDRPLGAGGAGLSAGQAQLLALARVWLRNPDLVVLDEATARVDPETEQRIAEAIAELMKGRTTFVIAHRLSTLDMVDEVDRVRPRADRRARRPHRARRQPGQPLPPPPRAGLGGRVGRRRSAASTRSTRIEDPTMHRSKRRRRVRPSAARSGTVACMAGTRAAT